MMLRFQLAAISVLLVLVMVTAGWASSDVPDEATKIEALKLGYILNGNSMVRWGSIDLNNRTLTPPPTVVRTIPIEPPKKKKER